MGGILLILAVLVSMVVEGYFFAYRPEDVPEWIAWGRLPEPRRLRQLGYVILLAAIPVAAMLVWAVLAFAAAL